MKHLRLEAWLICSFWMLLDFWCSELNCFTLCICWSFPKVWSSAARNHHRTLHCRIRKACMSLDGWPNTTCFYLLSEIMFWPCHLISSPCSPFLPFSRWQRRQQRFLRLDCTIHVVIATSQSLVSGFILGTKVGNIKMNPPVDRWFGPIKTSI